MLPQRTRRGARQDPEPDCARIDARGPGARERGSLSEDPQAPLQARRPGVYADPMVGRSDPGGRTPRQTVLSDDDIARLRELAARIVAWDGSPSTAAGLREDLRSSPMPERNRNDPTMEVLRVLGGAYRNRKKPLPRDKFSEFSADPQLARLLAPFLGDPAMGRWPFQDPHRIDDGEALSWLSILARVRVPAEGVAEFAWMMFCTRRRKLWVPASEALSALARTDGAPRNRLRALWNHCFPSGPPPSWRAGGDGTRTSAEAVASFGGLVHAQRHLLHAGCGLLARGVDAEGFQGLEAARICLMVLKGDPADASAFLLALRQLLRSDATRAPVLEHVLKRAGELRPDPQCDEALCELIDDLREEERSVRAALIQHVSRPRWQDVKGLKEKTDTLWSWLDVIDRLARQGEVDAVNAARREAGPARPALELRLHGPEAEGTAAPVARAVELLHYVRDPHLRATEPTSSVAVALVELLSLLARKDLAALNWSSLVARAGGEVDDTLRGTVAEVGRADLLVTLTRDAVVAEKSRGLAPPAILLRDATLSADVTVELAASQNGFVATQVAIQVERLLREADDDVERIRLLWGVLRRDPPQKFFTELEACLRGCDTPLHRVVKAMQELDKSRASKPEAGTARASGRPSSSDARDAEPSLVDQLDASIRAYRSNLDLLEASPDRASRKNATARRALRSLLASLRTVRETSQDGDPLGPESMPERWRKGYRQALLGRGDGGGLGEWLKWTQLEGVDLERLCRRFQSALEAIETASLATRLDRCADLGVESKALAARIDRLAWPEQVVSTLIDGDVERYIAHRVEETRRAGIEAERLRRAILEGDEEKVLAFVTEEQVSLLPQEELKRLSGFLLGHLRLAAAHRLRALAQGRAAGAEPVQLPAVWTYLAPLFVGVSSGPIFVLDVGEAFLDVSHRAQSAITVTLTFGLSLLLLAADFLSHMAVARRDRRAYERMGRVLLLYLATACVAGGVSFVVLLVTQHPFPSLPGGWPLMTWTGLSLFFGIFLGLVIQGRRMATDVDPR